MNLLSIYVYLCILTRFHQCWINTLKQPDGLHMHDTTDCGIWLSELLKFHQGIEKDFIWWNSSNTLVCFTQRSATTASWYESFIFKLFLLTNTVISVLALFCPLMNFDSWQSLQCYRDTDVHKHKQGTKHRQVSFINTLNFVMPII